MTTSYVSGRMKAEEFEHLINAYKKTKRYSYSSRRCDRKYLKKTIGGYIDFGDTMITMNKPHIQTNFWFAEYGYDYDEKQALAEECGQSETFFIKKNMAQTDARHHLDLLEDSQLECYLFKDINDSDGAIGCFIDYIDKRNPAAYKDLTSRKLNEEEKETYKTFLLQQQNQFEKRLHTYLKRYGMEHVYASTFWGDR